MQLWNKRSRKSKFIILLLFIAILIYWNCLPSPIFHTPNSIVLLDNNDQLLGARIAADGQWRFPEPDSLPKKYIQALLTFEDKRFFNHPGIDFLSLFRAVYQNIKAGKVVSGGSTISMQVIRLSRQSNQRTIIQKMIEMILATRLEIGYTKEDILKLYASQAPFGGNVVGIEAASWRYFGKSPSGLSWAEAATLAVLPNSPSLIHPGRNRELLKSKRNRLLDRMLKKQMLDSLSWELAKEEALPEKPLPLPRIAPHLLDYFALNTHKEAGKRTKIQSTIDRAIQTRAEFILQQHLPRLSSNGIHNGAALVIDVETGKTLAYVGNINGTGPEHHEFVDIVNAPRSTGSILKPFLFTLAIQEGLISSKSLIEDIPTVISGFQPENFHQEFDGAVQADRALIRSLNIPFVYLLQEYGLEKFHFYLKKLGIRTINKPPDHYGLSLILGGAEGTLWDITNAYVFMARTLNHYLSENSRYTAYDRQQADILEPLPGSTKTPDFNLESPPLLDAGAIWHCFQAMQQLERPDEQGKWEQFNSRYPIAWKTGTSYGFRDAWAVGVTPQYVVGVWIGNADGEGRPGLVGSLAAAPVLFDLFDLLPSTKHWSSPPYDALTPVEICQQDGYRARPICPSDTIWLPSGSTKLPTCPFHKTLHLDSTQRWQVTDRCVVPNKMVHKSWFVLPPLQAHYFAQNSPYYRPAPPFREDCFLNEREDNPMQLIYPNELSSIFIPRELDGSKGKVVFRATHRRAEATIFWHLGSSFLGKTEQFHELEMAPPKGNHLLILIDEQGYRLERSFNISG